MHMLQDVIPQLLALRRKVLFVDNLFEGDGETINRELQLRAYPVAVEVK